MMQDFLEPTQRLYTKRSLFHHPKIFSSHHKLKDRKRIEKIFNKMTVFDDMMKKAKTGEGFLAALDQSGGSTPKALTAYGVPTDVSTNIACTLTELFLSVQVMH